MNVYYERELNCGCGRRMRQTTLRLPLGRIAKDMARVMENNFCSHDCNFDITYTEWKLGNEYFAPYYISATFPYYRPRKKKNDKTERVHKALDLLK